MDFGSRMVTPMSGAEQIVATAGGIGVILAVLGDAIGTLIVTRGRTGRWRPTRLWYSATWRVTRAVAARTPARLADFALNVYPALSLLGLLVVWLLGLLGGWLLVYWGIGVHPGGATDWGSLVYFAGASLLAAGFGSPTETSVRMLSLVETVTGLGTIALLISYLPALYGAYSRREARLLTLDDFQGIRLTPVSVIAVHTPRHDVEAFRRFCAEWEMWTAEVLESHVSYPMLALFRSQSPGQSWISALGVVTDAATLAVACIEGADQSEPYFLYRRGRRAVGDIADRLDVPEWSGDVSWVSRDNFDLAWSALLKLQIPLRDKEEAWQRLQELRAPYGERLQQLIDFLLAPHGFWGHSAEATVAAEVARATEEARARARQTRPVASLRPRGSDPQ